MPQGTPRELRPVTERVLAWVATVRQHGGVDREDVRAIELCALATREAAMFFDLYGIGDPDASAAQVQDERRAPGRLPEAEGRCGEGRCHCGGCVV